MIAAAAAPPASAGPVYVPIVWQPAPSKLVVGANTVTNVGDCDGLVINCPNRLYAGEGRREPVDEIRHEDDANTIFRMDDQ